MERKSLDRNSNLASAQANDAIKGLTDFYSLYLIHGKTPGEIIKDHPEWKSLWHHDWTASTAVPPRSTNSCKRSILEKFARHFRTGPGPSWNGR